MKYILIFFAIFSITNTAFCDDVVCHDPQGFITQTYISIDLHTVGILDQNDNWLKPECIRVSRGMAESITPANTVNVSAASNNFFKDELIITMTPMQIQFQQLQMEQLIEVDPVEESTRGKLTELGFTDEEITLILSAGN